MIVRRPKAVITGANGGIGRACARVLGATTELILTDAATALEEFARELQLEGYSISGTVVGDLGDARVLDELAGTVGGNDGFTVLIHACGLPPSAPWRRVIEVNYVATVKLLRALRPFVRAGTAAVLIASVAGYLAPTTEALETVLADPFSPRICDSLEPLLLEMAGPAGAEILGLLSYALSKRKIIDLCATGAQDWGSAGARIMSISPGMIYTPMGRHEADIDPLARQMVTATPVGRWGTPLEIASAACFLASPAASFITGSDLKVDGGSLALGTISPEAWLESIRSR